MDQEEDCSDGMDVGFVARLTAARRHVVALLAVERNREIPRQDCCGNRQITHQSKGDAGQ